MSKKPLISVVMPAFNSFEFIEQAVQSVICQSYSNWELIIVNDGSTDETDAYLTSISHPAIRIFHQRNKGASAARNAGLQQCTGDYITFLDADDVLPLTSLEARANYLTNHPDVDIVDGVVSIGDNFLNEELRRYQPYYKGLLLPRLLRLDDKVFFGIIYMFRSNLLNGIEFNENMTHSEDLFFYLTIASKRAIRYEFVNEVIYFYRKSDASAMSDMEGLEKGYLQLLKNVGYLNVASLLEISFFRIKVASILFFCWRSKGSLYRAGTSVIKCIFP